MKLRDTKHTQRVSVSVRESASECVAQTELLEPLTLSPAACNAHYLTYARIIAALLCCAATCTSTTLSPSVICGTIRSPRSVSDRITCTSYTHIHIHTHETGALVILLAGVQYIVSQTAPRTGLLIRRRALFASPSPTQNNTSD